MSSASNWNCVPILKFSVNVMSQLIKDLQLEEEITYPADIENNFLKLDFSNPTKGETLYKSDGSELRKTVMVKTRRTIIHTHPITSKPYPSIEDIKKSVKHADIICYNIIVGKWGTFVIYSNQDFYNNIKEQYYKENGVINEKEFFLHLEDLKIKIDKATANLYELNKNYPNIIIKEKEAEYINKKCGQLEQITGLTIKFIPINVFMNYIEHKMDLKLSL